MKDLTAVDKLFFCVGDGSVKGTCEMLLLARQIRDVVVMMVGDMKICVGYCARKLTFQNS